MQISPSMKFFVVTFKMIFFSDARDSEMMRKFVDLDDPEDRVFGAFVMGKVCSF